MIIGYNDEKEVFTLFTRLEDQNMHIIDVSYSDMQKSLIEKGSWYLLYRYTPCEIKLDIQLIRQELSHYLYSSQSSGFIRGTRYGIKAMECLCEYLTRQYRHNEDMDYRLTRGLFEHKSLMLNMCKYLISDGYDLSENILIRCEQAFGAAKRIHFLALKSYVNASGNRNIGERIIKQFDILLNCEREYIPILLKQLCV